MSNYEIKPWYGLDPSEFAKRYPEFEQEFKKHLMKLVVLKGEDHALDYLKYLRNHLKYPVPLDIEV